MQQTFTLREDAWLRDGPLYGNRNAIAYRVGGLPDGRTARVANFEAPNGNDWRIMWINADNTQTDWIGHYGSVAEALAALQNNGA